MDDYRKSFLVVPQPYPPQRPIPWAQPSPQSTGTKDTGSSSEDLICNHSERSRPSLAFPTATMCTRPYNTYTNLQTSLSKLLHQKIDQPQRTAARWSPHDVVCFIVVPTAFRSTLTLLITELPPQAHVGSFLTITKQQVLQIITHHG